MSPTFTQSKGCEDYCTNKGQPPEGMCPENKCESYDRGFRCKCTEPYEQDEDEIHCRRKAMCRDGGGNEICSEKNATCEELLSDTKLGYKCECKQGYERVGNNACISKCDRKNCKEKNAECEFYGDNYEAVCKCPLMMTFVNDKCSKLAEHSYVGQLAILKRNYRVYSVSERSKRSTDDINDSKLRSDIDESLKNVYADYKYSKLLNCTEEGEILNCNLELQFKEKVGKEELRKIADPSVCIPLTGTDYCWIKPKLILKRIHEKEVFHATDPCTPLVRSTVCGLMTTCKQEKSTNAFTCTCKKGFQSINTFKPTISANSLVHVCEDINECLDENICPNTTNCKNTFGDYECFCKIGHYKESEGDTKKDGCLAVCDPSPCVHGKCEKVGDHGFACSCDGHYTGVYCNVTNDVVVKAKKDGTTNAAIVGGVLGAILAVILIGGYLFIRKLKKSKGDEHEYMQPRKRGALSEMRLGKRQTERDDDIELRQSGRRPVRPLPERQDRRDSGEFRRGFGGSTSMMSRDQNSRDEYEEEERVRRPLPERRDNTDLGKNRMIPRPRVTRSEDQYDEIHQTREERPRRHFTKSSESLPQDDKKVTSLHYKNKAYEDD
ncbi:neurogenic locus notch homolog protein 1-like [Stegodyphus dumicola]|uniref:neurogenic locus notch homolog protein 1-like n=1 Tax=Stegodyphus dumicola TaxID=202533 RepID=UPI0015A8A899|nr:neurogenic locus notch homolog protein 1-like [Stegodyphus dumicola]